MERDLKFYEERETEFFNYLEEVTGDFFPMFKEIYNTGGEDFQNLWEYPEDYQDPSRGSVGGLIYYTDTEPFARNYFNEIDQYLKDYHCHTERISQNDMTWIIWGELIHYLKEFKYQYEEQEKQEQAEE